MTPSIFTTDPRPIPGPLHPLHLVSGKLVCPTCRTPLSAHTPPECPECGQQIIQERKAPR